MFEGPESIIKELQEKLQSMKEEAYRENERKMLENPNNDIEVVVRTKNTDGEWNIRTVRRFTGVVIAGIYEADPGDEMISCALFGLSPLTAAGLGALIQQKAHRSMEGE